MGKATILSNLGNGLYEVRQDIGTTEANASIASLQTSIAELDAQIITATTELNIIAATLATAQGIYDAAVTAYAAAVATDPKASTKDWETANVELVRQQLLLSDAQRELSRLQANKAQLERDRNTLQAASFERTLQAWCVDYTDAATGEVATIEIPGEPKYTLIAPGARAHTNTDGRTLARQVMTGPQAYFNAAILPGWQKFKPTYRRGTITALDGDVATVALADDRSSAQNLVINQASTLTGVPIVYQDCNGDVFEVGDDCVVEFQGQNWSNPKVIGFQSNPKQCGYFRVYYQETAIATIFFIATNNTTNLALAQRIEVLAYPLVEYFSSTQSGQIWSDQAYALDFFPNVSTSINSNYLLASNKYWFSSMAYENPPVSYTLRPHFKIRTELGAWSSATLTTENLFAASTIAKDESGLIVYIVIGYFTTIAPFFFLNSQRVGISYDGLSFSISNRLPNDAWKAITTRASDNKICAVGSTYSATSDDGGFTWSYASFAPFQAQNNPIVRASGSYFVQIETNQLSDISNYIYSNDGLTWTNANFPEPIRCKRNGFAAGKNNKFIIVPVNIVSQKFIFISKNPASGFEKINFPSGTPDCFINAVQYNPQNDDFIASGYLTDETQSITFAIKF